jgi:hypothetical protein
LKALFTFASLTQIKRRDGAAVRGELLHFNSLKVVETGLIGIEKKAQRSELLI